LRELPDQHEKQRHEKDGQKSGREHAAEHAGADGLAAGGSCTRGKDQRRHTQDEGHGGHDDRPEAKLGRLSGRLSGRHARVEPMIGKIHKEDRILG